MRGCVALRPPATQGSQIGFFPGLGDENQLSVVQIWLAGTPALPPSPDVGMGLFKGEQAFL